MDIWIEMIDKVGLPIVIIFGLSIFIVKYIDKKEKTDEKIRENEKVERQEEKQYFINEIERQRGMFEESNQLHKESLADTVREFGVQINKVVEGLNKTSSRLEKVEGDVSEIKIRLETRD